MRWLFITGISLDISGAILVILAILRSRPTDVAHESMTVFGYSGAHVQARAEESLCLERRSPARHRLRSPARGLCLDVLVVVALAVRGRGRSYEFLGLTASPEGPQREVRRCCGCLRRRGEALRPG